MCTEGKIFKKYDFYPITEYFHPLHQSFIVDLPWKGIFLKNLNSNTTKQLTEAGEAPILSRKAKFILYQGKINGVTGIRSIDLKTMENTPITKNPELCELPDLAPNGKHIYYQRKIDGKFSIWRINRDGSSNIKIIWN